MAKRLLSLQKPGKIINIGSMTSFIGMYNVSAYAASKGGVLQMTKAFSNELAESGIQVNCICPGYIRLSGLLLLYVTADHEFADTSTPH
jgi:2-deoxy-D-gluconate 3-dehydrogenase